jgi:hypothetical protein
MTFLRSIRSDLLNPRILPLLAVLLLGLVGAVAYIVVGGASSTPPPTPVAAITSPSSSQTGVAVSQAPANPNEAVSETTSGVKYQHQGASHNPFKPLVVAKTASSTSAATTPKVSSSPAPKVSSPPSTGSSQSGGTSSGGTKPKSKPKPKQPQTVYTVNVLFGEVPESATAATSPELKSYAGLKRLEPLPSASNSLIVNTGVSSGGKAAIFTLVHEAILSGAAACLPSASQCEMLDMAPGTTEQLNFLAASGQTVFYQLKVLSITQSVENAAAAARFNARVSRAGQSLLHRDGPPILEQLRFAQDKGVLVYTPHH